VEWAIVAFAVVIMIYAISKTTSSSGGSAGSHPGRKVSGIPQRQTQKKVSSTSREELQVDRLDKPASVKAFKKQSENKEIEKLKTLKCPENCQDCYPLSEKRKLILGDQFFDMGKRMARGFEFIVAPMGFRFKVGGQVIFAAFTPERKLFHFLNLSEWTGSQSDDKKVNIGAAFVKSSKVHNEALVFTESHYQEYSLFFFSKAGIYPYLYGSLFSLFPTEVKKVAEYFYIPALVFSPKRVCISGLCKRGKELSLVCNFFYNDLVGTYRILPGKKKYPVVLESIGTTSGELLPKALHLPYIELFLFGRSYSLETASFGKAFELLYLRGDIPKTGLKKLLMFFLENSKIPEFDYILKLYLKYQIFNLKALAEFAEKVIAKKEHSPKVIAFAHRVIAEYLASVRETDKALKHAQKAFSLDKNVGVKRLISKLQKQQ